MAEKKPAAKSAPKAAKKKGASAHKFYTISGNKVERKNKSCPKCGQGVFLAEHKDRVTCGQCHYTEFKKR